MSNYVSLVKEFIDLEKRSSMPNEEIKQNLSKPTLRSKHRSGIERHYKVLVIGRFITNSSMQWHR